MQTVIDTLGNFVLANPTDTAPIRIPMVKPQSADDMRFQLEMLILWIFLTLLLALLGFSKKPPQTIDGVLTLITVMGLGAAILMAILFGITSLFLRLTRPVSAKPLAAEQRQSGSKIPPSSPQADGRRIIKKVESADQVARPTTRRPRKPLDPELRTRALAAINHAPSSTAARILRTYLVEHPDDEYVIRLYTNDLLKESEQRKERERKGLKEYSRKAAIDECWRYYLRITTSAGEVVYKIGISNNVRRRILDLNPGNLKIETLNTERMPRRAAIATEQVLLELYARYRYNGPDLLNSGNTDLFVHDVLGLDGPEQ